MTHSLQASLSETGESETVIEKTWFLMSGTSQVGFSGIIGFTNFINPKESPKLSCGCAGGEKYSESYSQFLSSTALYLVLYDLSKGASELDTIRPWLFNIKVSLNLCNKKKNGILGLITLLFKVHLLPRFDFLANRIEFSSNMSQTANILSPNTKS